MSETMMELAGGRAKAEFGCRYVIAYIGRCGKLIANTDHVCGVHEHVKCRVCGKQAVNECSHTGQFVCGTPLCNDCEGFTDTSKAGGSWGFMNHTHRRKPSAIAAEMASHEVREVSAADLGLGDIRARAAMEVGHG